MSSWTRAIAATLVVLLGPVTLAAQTPQSSDAAKTISVPRLISVGGVYRPVDRGRSAGVETVTLAIYTEETGGAPLWQETQTVSLDAAGRYTVLLGATESAGIPLAVFASGEGRWLELTWARMAESEGPRTRLTSVPYALKASDADTLGGRPASEYVLTPSARGQTGDAAAAPGDAIAPPDIVAGTLGSLAKYVTATDLGQSSIFETPGRLGINTSAPVDIVHSRFTNTNGGLTGFAVQNLGNTNTSYSGMLFYDHTGVLGQFQGFNNSTHEYRINNIARTAGVLDGSINFMLGGASRFRIDSTSTAISGYTTIHGRQDIFTDAESSGLFVSNSHPTDGAAIRVQATGNGVDAFSLTGAAIAGMQGSLQGWAGLFDGDVNVGGTLFKGGGAFRIDHPLDPANKYLSHSFVESPEMKNIYDGVAVLDHPGEAIVTLPDWFEALNQNFRYQLTPMGAAFLPYVADEIAGNKFRIAGGMPGKKVSWQVTGIRHDAFANANRIQVEELKTGPAAGTYLHPEAFGMVPDKGQSNAGATDPKARQEQMKARLRAISQKPAAKK